MPSLFLLDPQAVLDFAFDWSAWLAAGETIAAKTVTATTGVTVDSSSEAGGVVTVWLSHGTLGADARVVCHITTNQGRQDDRSLSVSIRDR